MVGDDGGLFSGDDYYLQTTMGRNLSAVDISGTTIAFGSPDFAI